MYGRFEKCIKGSGQKSEGERPLRRLKHRWEDNITTLLHFIHLFYLYITLCRFCPTIHLYIYNDFQYQEEENVVIFTLRYCDD
jgi:hypothetical protein